MFENLEKLQVNPEKTAAYTIYQIEGEPVLHLAPATEANKPYFNALLKRSRRNQRRIASGSFTAGVIAENRDNDRVLFPKFVIRGWDKMKTADGKPAKADEATYKAFVDALPDYIFDDMRNFATDSQNFVDVLVDAEDVAGNSQ
jgi:hypothetical protein